MDEGETMSKSTKETTYLCQFAFEDCDSFINYVKGGVDTGHPVYIVFASYLVILGIFSLKIN